jgi:hypothetical protein
VGLHGQTMENRLKLGKPEAADLTYKIGGKL